jgi:hypothetical protein
MHASGNAGTILDASRDRVTEAVWLQEMMRFRNSNRDGGSLEGWHTMHNREFGIAALFDADFINTNAARHESRVEAATKAQKEQSQRYRRHLSQIQRTYRETKNLGRRIQWMLKLSHDFEKEHGVEVGKLRPLCERWEWLPTKRRKHGALETDFDMLMAIAPYGVDDGLADRPGATRPASIIPVLGGNGK